MFVYFLFSLFLALASPLFAQEVSTAKLKALYNSLDPSSVSQHLAFYNLYSESSEGQQALRDAYALLSGHSKSPQEEISLPPLLSSSLHSLISIVNKHSNEECIELSDTELAAIDKLAYRLPHRKLLGHQAATEDEVLKLPINEIDLARGVLLSQLGSSPEQMRKIKSYEATLDLMALQILTRVSLDASPKAKIRAINRFIFEEMGFRFPPHSTYAKDIDLYTFLPSVLDSRRGVCLGVSILYICLAQRLNLDLEIVTPPGHIFVRWHKKGETINIETTARGINLPDEQYLGIDTRKLQQRNIKQTIGMAHFNQASVFLERKEYDKAMEAYTKAQYYLEEDKLLKGLMGYTALLLGDETLGKQLLQQVVDYLPDHAVSKETIPEDYLNGKVSADGIGAIFMRVDETRESLLKKKKALEDALEKSPSFREGIFSLAANWLQLHRSGEALQTLERYHEIDPNQATVEYYLAVLYAERLDYNKAWKHLRLAEALVKERQHDPEALLELRQELVKHCPE